MLLSIIVPVFNGERDILRCLKSFKLLKEEEIEVIVVNDGSTDNTKKICEEYQKYDKRIHLINQSNFGVSKARNVGLERAKGKYIGFVDADDELTEEYNEIISLIKSNDCDLYSFDFYVNNINGNRKQGRYLYKFGYNERNILYNNYLAGNSNCVWNNIYKNNIIKNKKVFFPEKVGMGEDCTFNARYFEHCKNVFYIKSAGYKYYADNFQSISKLRKISYLHDFAKIYEYYKKIYKLEKDLVFKFDCPYYIDMVYEILKNNKGKMTKKEKCEFRQSEFYKTIMKYKYNNRKREVKKWEIRWYLYLR